MKVYRLRKSPNPKYGFVVFSASYISPLDRIKDIETELSKKGYSGLVLFDQLLSIGNTSSRFLEMHFDGDKLSYNSAQTASDIKDEMRRFASSFYHKHMDKLDTTILSKPTRFKLRKGATI